MNINAETQLNLVIGNPIRHSQSPALHQRIYQALGLNAVMLASAQSDLNDLRTLIDRLNIKLIAVTLPHKTAVLAHADIHSDAVKALGAANTLINHHGIIHAHNTDVEGIRASLQHLSIAQKNILILGAGGAARAVGYSLKDCDAHLFWLNRTAQKAQLMAEQFGGEIVSDDLNGYSFDIIINTTPVGMTPNTDDTPLPGYAFQPSQTVFDLIYTPTKTRLLREAKSAGAHIINGQVMMTAQAIKQVELAYGLNIEGRFTFELHDH